MPRRPLPRPTPLLTLILGCVVVMAGLVTPSTASASPVSSASSVSSSSSASSSVSSPVSPTSASAAAGKSGWRDQSITVTGSITVPARYTRAELAALPQVTVPDQRDLRRSGQTLTGVSLQSLITAADPVLPDAKNVSLRVVATVSGRGRRVATALGELDPGFGAHPALLVLAVDGQPVRGPIALVFPGDLGFSRTVDAVRWISIAVAPADVVAVAAGSVRVFDGRRSVVLSAARLASLPSHTVTVNFLAGGGAQQHTETGPALITVLRAAHVRIAPDTRSRRPAAMSTRRR